MTSPAGQTRAPQPRPAGALAESRRRVGRFILAGVVVGFLAMMIFVSTLFWLHTQHRLSQRAMNSLMSIGIPVLVGILVIVPVIGAIRLALIQRRNNARLAETAAAAGFDPTDKPSADDKLALFRGLDAVDSLRKGSTGVARGFTGIIDGREVRVLRHTYVVWAGNHAQRVTHWVAAADAPAAWPAVRLWRSAVPTLVKMVRRFSALRSVVGETPDLENAAFNERWSLKTDDRSFAELLLTPEAQQFLVDSPAGDSWFIGKGVVARLRKEELDAELFSDFARGPIELLDLLPPELDAWDHAED